MPKQRVIIIEEETGKLSSLKSALKDKGFIVTIFQSCFDALTELNAQGADAIVSHSNLQDMSGFQLARLLKTHPSWKNRLLPIILIVDKAETIDSFSSRSSLRNIAISGRQNNDKIVNQIKAIIDKAHKDGYTMKSLEQYQPVTGKFGKNVDKNYNNIIDNLLDDRLVTSFINDLVETNSAYIQLIPKLFDFLSTLLLCDLAGVVSSQPTGNPFAVFKAKSPVNEKSFADLVSKAAKVCNLSNKPQAEILVSALHTAKGSTLKSSSIIPIRAKNNDLLGAIVIGWFNKNTLNSAAKRFLDRLELHMPPVLKALALQHEIAILKERDRYTSSIDPQTSLYNIEFLVGFLQQQLLFSHRQKLPVGLLMVDIDYFSGLKQQFSLATADNILISVANCLLKSVRGSDLIARYGEDLFAIVLPNTDLNGAKILAEKLRMEIGQMALSSEKDKRLPQVTVSIGCSSFTQDDLNPETIIRDAKLALRRAKEKGRNCVCE